MFENANQSESEDDGGNTSKSSNDDNINYHRIDSFDDLVSDTVPPPLPPKLSLTDCNVNCAMREKSSQSQNGNSSSHNSSEAFSFVYENLFGEHHSYSSGSDQEGSDLEAFDDADELANDSDNEMTEEQLKAVKLKTIARATSNTAFSKCYYVAREILTTEEYYVKKLHMLLFDLGNAIDEANKKHSKVT